jgi:hypothetical protein
MEQFWTWLAASVLGSIVTSAFTPFLKGYSKTKGENLATHEDLNKLVEQMKATTEATKAIEARISDEVWNKQRQWELKREVVFEATRRVAETYDALTTFGSALRLSQGGDQKAWEKAISDATTRWVSANAALDESLMFIQVVCDEATIRACNGFRKIAIDLAKQVALYDFSSLSSLLMLLNLSLSATRNALRRELGVPPLPTPQSNESSAVPSPD